MTAHRHEGRHAACEQGQRIGNTPSRGRREGPRHVVCDEKAARSSGVRTAVPVSVYDTRVPGSSRGGSQRWR